MADPATIYVGLKAVQALAGGVAKHSEGMTDAARLDSEALLTETQGLQRDTITRDELDRFLSATKASRSARGLSALSPNAIKIMTAATEISAGERQTVKADFSQRAANLRAAAKARRKGAKMSLLTGVVKAGVPIAQSFM